ncbi:MAG: ABC transporter permease [Planctomycetaceae bacterium]|nr:ABC transporter permease [Planctomycetaceae bacterium]
MLFRALTWQIGIKNFVLHPMRSLLTVLGIFIGVASVIWLLAIGEGISVKAQDQIAGLGADNIIIRSVEPAQQASISNYGIASYGVTRLDFERLKETLPTVVATTPIRELSREFRFSDRNVSGRLVGCTPDYLSLNRLDIREGRFLTDADQRDKANVCVLGAEVAQVLFPYEDPLGRSIHVEQDYYVVVGVMQSRTPSAGIGGSLAAQDFSLDVYVPIRTLWQRIGDMIVTRRGGSRVSEQIELSQITLKVRSTDEVLGTSEAIRNTLAKYHPREDYAIVVPLELLEQARRTKIMFMVMMGLVAAISLVVGGIGIMNIMLATVTERTREIGIRRALGAKRADIVAQFLAETVLMSVAGGLTGIIGGLTCRPIVEGLRAFVGWALPELLAGAPDVVHSVTPIVVPWSIPLAFGISVVVGVMFGLYPARRAAAMNPIEALRYVA